MKSIFFNIKNNAVTEIAVLSVLLVSLSVVFVWLVSNEFDAENLLGDARSQAKILHKRNNDLSSMLAVQEAEIERLNAKHLSADIVMDDQQVLGEQERDVSATKVHEAEADAERAREVAKVAQNELDYALEQSRKIERELMTQLTSLKMEKDAALKLSQNIDAIENAELDNLRNELNSALQQLEVANSELRALRRANDQKIPDLPFTARRPLPSPAKPLSSSPTDRQGVKSVFGQIKAVESANHFVVIQLNKTEGVLVGDALAVTRQGMPVGILKVYRVAKQGVVFTVLTPDLRDKVRVGDFVTLEK